MILVLLAIQAAVAPPADVSLRATVSARSVKVDRKGQATVSATATPDAGSVASAKRTSSNRYELQLDARIGDTNEIISGTQPQPATDAARPR